MAHPPTHAVHQLAHDGQADALAAVAGAEEGQKDLPLQPRRHAGAVVAHADLQASAAALARQHPQARAGDCKATAAPDLLVIGVDAKGGVYWGRERVTQVVLRERLRAAAVRNPSQAVRIDGDTQAPYQEVVHLLDLCQFEGLTHIAMRTRDGR
jgi:biopolymer transport protein ExbD